MKPSNTIKLNDTQNIDSIVLCDTIERGKQSLVNIPNSVIQLIQSVYDMDEQTDLLNQMSLTDYISLVFGGLKLKSFKTKKTPFQILN